MGAVQRNASTEFWQPWGRHCIIYASTGKPFIDHSPMTDQAVSDSKHPSAGSWTFVANDESRTRQLGQVLGELIEPGLVVALVGNLGSGKTRLVQAVAEALAVDRRAVSSPTFVLIHEYEGRLPVYHFDAYRLRDSDEFLDLGADELMDSEGVCLIEWADRVVDVLPADVLRITIDIIGPNARTFRFDESGPQSERTLTRLRDQMKRSS